MCRNALFIVLMAPAALAEPAAIAVAVHIDVFPFSSDWKGPVRNELESSLANKTVNGWTANQDTPKAELVPGFRNQFLFADWSTTPSASSKKLTLTLREEPCGKSLCAWVIVPTLTEPNGEKLDPIDAQVKEFYLPVLTAAQVPLSEFINRDTEAQARADVGKWFLVALHKMFTNEAQRNKFIRTALRSLSVAGNIGRVSDKAQVFPAANLYAKETTQFFAKFLAKPPAQGEALRRFVLSYDRPLKEGLECTVDPKPDANDLLYLENPVKGTVKVSLREYTADCTRKKIDNVTVDKKGCRE